MALDARQISEAEYCRLCDERGLPVFLSSAWLGCAAEVLGFSVYYLGFFEADALRFALAVQRRRLGPVVLHGAPLRGTGLPPATAPAVEATAFPALLDALGDWCRRSGVSYFQITVPEIAATAIPRGAVTEPIDNLEMALATWDEVRSIAHGARSMVRRALKNGLRAHWRSPERWRDYQSLLDETYSRQGLAANFPAPLYEGLSLLTGDRQPRLLAITRGRRTLAMIWLFVGAGRVHYWDAAASREGKQLGAGHLAAYAAVRWARHQGFETFDWVGTSVGGRGGSRPGIGQFKQAFGGQIVDYRIVYWRRPWLELLFRGYRAWRGWRNRPRAQRAAP